jgi:hypothetical protein
MLKPVSIGLLALLAGCSSVETQVEINAPAKDVRAILYDFADYPKWNPFLVSVEGTAEEGKQLYVTVKLPGKPEITGDVTITTATDSELSWRGSALSQLETGEISMGVPGILSADHEFIVRELGPSRTLLLNNDKLSGALVPFYGLKAVESGLDAMNDALKKRAEGGSR